MLAGKNICVLDLETLRSAHDCLHCGASSERHALDWRGEYHTYTPIGWDRKAELGLSIGCYFSYADMQLHWFDRATLEATVRRFVERQPLLVSFNGIGFDFCLMRTLLRPVVGTAALCDQFDTLATGSYDILAEIWKADPERKFERGLNSLGAISEANRLGSKEMDGATAPRLWGQGRYADVIAYNVGDVLKTKALFERIVQTGEILRGDGRPIRLPAPPLD